MIPLSSSVLNTSTAYDIFFTSFDYITIVDAMDRCEVIDSIPPRP